MSRYIDQDALCEFARHSTIGINANDIMRFPSIEIIYCKDCNFYDFKRTAGLKKYGYCEIYNGYKEADGFCDCGERRESE